jgi:hypothetical protein
METVTSRSPQEAWIINLICSTEQGKAPLLSGTIQINSKYEREILPAPFERKILKKMGYSNTADGMFANGFGHRTTTGVIFADHVNHRIFLCVPSHFFMFDEGARNALQLTSQQTTALQIYGGLRDHKQSGAWWMDLPVNNVQYLATALDNPQLIGYQVYKVIFKVDKDLAAWNTKNGSEIQIEESETADELMEFLSGKQLRKSPSTEIETKTPSAPTVENQNIKCPKCGTRVDKQDAKFCINCGEALNTESQKTSK